MRDLLGDASRPAARHPRCAQNGYANGSASLAVQSDQVADYDRGGRGWAQTAVQTRLTMVCKRPLGWAGPRSWAEGLPACAEALLDLLAARALPEAAGSQTERQRLLAVFSVSQT